MDHSSQYQTDCDNTVKKGHTQQLQDLAFQKQLNEEEQTKKLIELSNNPEPNHDLTVKKNAKQQQKLLNEEEEEETNKSIELSNNSEPNHDLTEKKNAKQQSKLTEFEQEGQQQETLKQVNGEIDSNILSNFETTPLSSFISSVKKNKNLQNYQQSIDSKLISILGQGSTKLMQNRCFPVKLIAKGGEGVIYDGFMLDENYKIQDVVFKFLFGFSKEDIQEEVDFMKSLKMCSQVIKFYKQVEIDEEIQVLVLEKCKWSLSQELKSMIRQLDFPEDKLGLILLDLLDGLIFFRIQQVLHLDIKPDNILVTHQDQYIYSDFGISSFYTYYQQISQVKGYSDVYASYEQINCAHELNQIQKETVNFSSDVYSLGKTFETIINVYKKINTDRCEDKLIETIETVIIPKMIKQQERSQCKYLHKYLIEIFTDKQSVQFFKEYDNRLVKIVNSLKDTELIEDTNYSVLQQIYYLQIQLNWSGILQRNQEEILKLQQRIKDLSFQFLSKSNWNGDNEEPYPEEINLEHFPQINSLWIAFGNCNVTELEIPSLLASLIDCKNLTSLSINLIQNQITNKGLSEIGKELGNIISLQCLSLYLQRNPLSEEGILGLAAGLQNCVDLTSLKLSLEYTVFGTEGSKILGKFFGKCQNLNSLSLGISKCQVDPYDLLCQLEYCKNLRSLTLSCQQEITGDKDAIFLALQKLINITYLNLDFCFLDIGPLGASKLGQSLRNCKDLSYLEMDLTGNNLGREGVNEIITPLKHCLNLQSLRLLLSMNQLDDLSFSEISSELKQCKELTSFDLNLGFISSLSALAVITALRNCTNLDSLSLDFGNIDLDDESLNKLGQAIGECTSLTSLNLHFSLIPANLKTGARWQWLKSTSIYKFCTSLQRCENLRSLDLQLKNIEMDDCGECYAAALKHSMNFTDLSFIVSENNIDYQGASKLFNAIGNCTNLISLTLQIRGNDIGNQGLLEISNALEQLSNITDLKLNLVDNEISEIGVSNLAKGIRNYINLISLDVDFSLNIIGDEGVSNFCKVLNNFINLESLNVGLASTNISVKFVQSIITALENINTLKLLYLDITNNEFDSTCGSLIIKELQNCKNINFRTLDLDI